MEKAYKVYDEMNGKMKTFKNHEEMNEFILEKNIQCPVRFLLEVEHVYIESEEATFKVKIGDENGNYEQKVYLYAHTDEETNRRSYSWTHDFQNGSPRFDTVNQCLKHYFESDDSEVDESETVSCTSCGDGGCIHCRPSWFIR